MLGVKARKVQYELGEFVITERIQKVPEKVPSGQNRTI